MSRDAVGVTIVLAGPLLVVLIVALCSGVQSTGMPKDSNKREADMSTGDQVPDDQERRPGALGAQVPPPAESEGGERIDPTTEIFDRVADESAQAEQDRVDAAQEQQADRADAADRALAESTDDE